MKIVNPNSEHGKVDAAAVQARLAAILTNKAAERAVSFEDIRAALPANLRDKATDGVIHQAALDAGLKVEQE